MSILPTPFKTYIPKLYWDDPQSDGLAGKADEHIEDWKEDVCRISRLIEPERCPEELLGELGYYLNAGLLAGDSDVTKRQKILRAISTHKRRGAWEGDAKVRIDSIVGGDSQIIPSAGADEWMMIGDGLTPSAYYWSIFGGDGVATDYGIRLIGLSSEEVIAGVIWIDVDSSTLTAAEVETLKLNLEDVVPAYFMVFLGYMVVGVFTPYANGQMG